MKKDLIFAPILALVAVALFLLKFTGMTAHIAVSVVGVILLVAYAVLTKKEWKIPALEIVMRVFYGIALITGIVIMNVSGLSAVATIHRISALVFAALLAGLFIHKAITLKKS